jgi:hypothetical protein
LLFGLVVLGLRGLRLRGRRLLVHDDDAPLDAAEREDRNSQEQRQTDLHDSEDGTA